ncbi:tRNA uridine-5-carboxymethylaminomethyl(34) synthesis GTPase MnmE [Salinispira pacifica]
MTRPDDLQVSEDPIAALATPYARSALAVIRMSGAGALGRLAPLFSGSADLAGAPAGTVHHGYLIDGDRRVDEVMVAVYRAPHSYTGQESAEIFCHGSLPGIERILALLFRRGFRQADPGEFTLRAFLNGKLDLTRAEAVQELVAAQSDRAQSLALDRLGGAVTGWIDGVKKQLLQIMAAVEVQLDYPEEEIGATPLPLEMIDSCSSELRRLADTYRAGRLYQEGVRVAVAGRTNAGKSSLFNLLLRSDRSIVSSVHGTTRDYIEGSIVLRGVPIRLYDTAGLRVTAEEIESEGIRRSRELIDASACVLYLVDSTAGITEEDRENLAALEGRAGLLRIWNKIDLEPATVASPDGAAPDGWLPLSSTTGEGLDRLHARLFELVAGNLNVGEGEPIIDSLRQKQLIDAAVESLERVRESIESEMPLDVAALDLQEALHALGEITGEVTSADVLDAIFSGFCVGK